MSCTRIPPGYTANPSLALSLLVMCLPSLRHSPEPSKYAHGHLTGSGSYRIVNPFFQRREVSHDSDEALVPHKLLRFV
jgi:hypothetical protein